MGAVATKAVFALLRSTLTEKAIMNLVVVLASWLAKRTSNDLDDRLVALLKEAVSKRYGKPGNLYPELR